MYHSLLQQLKYQSEDELWRHVYSSAELVAIMRNFLVWLACYAERCNTLINHAGVGGRLGAGDDQ